MNRNQQTTNYKLSITIYLHLSCNDRDKGAEVTFTLQSLGGSGGPKFHHSKCFHHDRHHCVIVVTTSHSINNRLRLRTSKNFLAIISVVS